MSDNRDIAANLMKQAAVLVSSKRGQQHGDVTTSFTMIAELWSVWINHSIAKATGIPPTPPIHLTAFDALQMMSMVKKARGIYGNRAEPDHYIDDIGYTGLAGALNMLDHNHEEKKSNTVVRVYWGDQSFMDYLNDKNQTSEELLKVADRDFPEHGPHRLTATVDTPIPEFLRNKKKA